MKIGQKSTLGFIITILCIWIIVLSTINTYSNIHKEIEILEKYTVPSAVIIANVDVLVNEIAHWTMDYMLYGQEKDKKKIKLNIEDIKKDISIYSKYETHIGLKEQKLAKELVIIIQRYITEVVKIVDMKEQGVSIDELMKREQKTVHPMIVTLSDQFKEYKTAYTKKLTEGVINIHKAHIDNQQLLLLLAILITFFAIAIAFFITRSIVKPIHALHKGIEIIGQGNLDYNIGTKAKDEIGQLSKAFDKMTKNLQKAVVSIVNLEKEITEREQVEKALRESEKKYRTLLKTTSEGYWIIDPELETIEVNQALCNMLGYSEKEMLKKTPFEFVDDKNEKIFIKQISKIPITSHRSYEITLKKKNGEDLYTHFNASTIRDESGDIQGSFALITNLTEKKQAQEERDRLAIAIEQVAESVFITDRDGIIQYVNPAFERLTGYSRKDAIGQTPRILKSGKHDALFYKKMWETITRGDTWHGHFINKKKDGSFYEADATISPVSDTLGKITNFVSIKHGVTMK